LFFPEGKAVKECLPNGEWYVHPRTNQTWTNFNGCTQLHVKDPNDGFLMLKVGTRELCYSITKLACFDASVFDIQRRPEVLLKKKSGRDLF
jgi:hypothetical protein